MLLMIEVEESDNCPFDVTRSFQTVEAPRPIARVATTGPDGKEAIYQIVGWSAQGPTQAYAALVDDSGEGAAMLIYGDAEGVRLKPVDSTEAWSLASPLQWGDIFLLLDRHAQVE
jgi:hypothetical protein